MARECSDCRDNEKMFNTIINYKCQNDYCENYIKPTVVKDVEDYKQKLIVDLVQQLFKKDKEILRLKQELWFLK